MLLCVAEKKAFIIEIFNNNNNNINIYLYNCLASSSQFISWKKKIKFISFLGGKFKKLLKFQNWVSESLNNWKENIVICEKHGKCLTLLLLLLMLFQNLLKRFCGVVIFLALVYKDPYNYTMSCRANNESSFLPNRFVVLIINNEWMDNNNNNNILFKVEICKNICIK